MMVGRRELAKALAGTAILLAAWSLHACAVTDVPGTGSDMPIDALVRGAAPGGLAGMWSAPDGSTLALSDDGTAELSVAGGAGGAGNWRQGSATRGEVYLPGGEAWIVILSGDELEAYRMQDVGADGMPVDGAQGLGFARAG